MIPENIFSANEKKEGETNIIMWHWGKFFKFLTLDLSQEILIYFRPLKDGERPLFLTLLWGSAHSGHGFRLKDQMDNSPIWDDFKEAELEAFLRMYEGNDFIF